VDDWKVWLVVFLGFATALAIGVAVIAVHTLSAYAARRRDRIERLSPPRPRFREGIFVRRVTFALLMLFPVLVVGAAAVLGVMHLLTAR
jgi:hypothetical protein